MKIRKKDLIIWIIVIVGLFLLFGLFGFGRTGYGMMGSVYGSGMMFFGWFFGALFIIALVLMIIWLFKQIQKK